MPPSLSSLSSLTIAFGLRLGYDFAAAALTCFLVVICIFLFFLAPAAHLLSCAHYARAVHIMLVCCAMEAACGGSLRTATADYGCYVLTQTGPFGTQVDRDGSW